jgi:hypothetical protein
MGTPFDEVYDLAMMVIRDYKLDYLYENDPEIFYNQLEAWLIKAISMFDGCVTSLDYDLDKHRFIEKLSLKEKNILSEYIVILWFESNTNVTEQITLLLQGRDRKTTSEASNLKAKMQYLNTLREKVRQDIADYQLNNFDSFKF